ncbi:MAG: ribosome small subunit-dependent GTPase A [Negativicutes bacterium]
MNSSLLNDYGYLKYIKSIEMPTTPFGYAAARVVAQHKSSWQVVTASGEYRADLSGKYRYDLDAKGGYPAVGDYVLVQIAKTNDLAVIHELLPRKTVFYRADQWHAAAIQIVAANFDTVFVCMSLNRDYNIARLERYLVMAKESGADIVVVLTKADLCPDVELQLEICRAVAGHVPVYAVSVVDGAGMEQLAPYFAQGNTVVALGSSGVGKSSLVNALFGQEIMKVAAIREDDARGRHTTVHRELILLPGGGLYLDTPGMRELGLVDAGESVAEMFEDIEQLADACRFSDCRHNGEPGCAIRAALANGELSDKRYKRYVKFQQELSYAEDPSGHRAQKTEFFKQIHKSIRANRKPGR